MNIEKVGVRKKIRVRIAGTANVSICEDVPMTQEQFDQLSAELDTDKGGEAVECALFDFADMRRGDFDDLILEEFEKIA